MINNYPPMPVEIDKPWDDEPWNWAYKYDTMQEAIEDQEMSENQLYNAFHVVDTGYNVFLIMRG